MSTTYTPNEHEIIIRWSDLETALLILVSPENQKHIQTTLQELREDYRQEGSERATYLLLTMAHWLMSDGINIRWTDLETAWRMVAGPKRQSDIVDTLQVLSAIHQTQPRQAALKLVTATMWITGSSERVRSDDG